MARCTNCRFLFEPTTLGLLPDCPQCGGATIAVLNIQASDGLQAAQPRIKLAAVKTGEPAG